MSAPLAVVSGLARHSVDVLEAGQAPSGAFVASPAFPVYHYAWLRDGAFCAHALDLVGRREAAGRFHDWVARSVEAHRDLVEAAIRGVQDGEALLPTSMPPARYTLDGALERPDDEPWPNFQVDGYGMWLWAFAAHLGPRPVSRADGRTVELVARYLAATWRLECFNCWEEFDGGVHASTHAAVLGGLEAAARLLGDARWTREAGRVRAAMLDAFVSDGRFQRGAADARLDGSLLWLGVPFGVLAPDDPLVVATVEAIRRELTRRGGGVYRYRGDTYYGGGEWLLLTCWLGWHDAVLGNGDGVEAARGWVQGQARENGDLPEQVTEFAQAPEMVEPWRRRWGAVATPLLWSHAMYLIMEAAAAAA